MNSKSLRIIQNMLESSNGEELTQLISAMREGQYRYILAFDMGCGNTSSAIGALRGDEMDFSIPWDYQYMSHGELKEMKNSISIPTMLGYSGSEPVLGPEAMRFGDAAESFKNVPSPGNLQRVYGSVGDRKNVTLGEVWQDFFRAAFRRALEAAAAKITNPAPSPDNVIFAVAHPADQKWEKHLDAYKELICRATGLKPWQVITFSEAKASMQYVRACKEYPLDWAKGVVIIDLGASTIDVEYLAYDQEPMEASITMAGRDVDRLLGHWVLRQMYPEALDALPANQLPDEAFFQAHKEEIGMNKRAFSYMMRLIKEQVCGSDAPVEVRFRIGGEIRKAAVDRNLLQSLLKTESFPFICYNVALANYINGVREMATQRVQGTWYGYLEKITAYLFSQIMQKNRQTDTIIVTGGTANLAGIREAVLAGARAAGVNDVELRVMSDPLDYEKTVPFGSLSYIRNVLRNTETILAFPDQLKKIVLSDLAQYVPRTIRDAIHPSVSGRIAQKLDEWEQLPENHPDSSLNGLVRTVQKIYDREDDQKELDGQVEAAFARIGAANEATLPETFGAVNGLLKMLSSSGAYDQPISLRRVNCRVSTEDIITGIGNSIPNVCVGLFDGMFLWYLGHGHDTLISSKPRIFGRPSRRSLVKKNVKEKNPFYAGILSPIEDALRAEYESSGGFGIVEQTMEDLEKHINQAMFLGNTERKEATGNDGSAGTGD